MKARSAGLAVAVAALAAAGSIASQEPPAPVFPSQAAAITVDVVVQDAKGEPVRGLAREDFTILEDGREQRIVGFEARNIQAPPDEAAAPAATPAGETATNEGPASQPGRVLALLIDDLGISAPVAAQLKPALAGWIRARAAPTDEVTIMTTSGAQWWSDVVGTGREDLLTVLGRVQGRKLARPGGGEMSDAEAYRISVLEQSTEWLVGAGSRSRPPDGVATAGGGVKLLGPTATERVTQRWLDSRVCPPCTDPNEPPLDCREIRQCIQRVQGFAGEIHAASVQQNGAVLAAISRLSRALAAAPGRKSILLVSESLLRDASLDVPFRDAIDAAQRSNSSVYFLDARGLAGASFLGAASASQPPRSQDVGAMGAEESVLATAGGESLADETGGSLTRSNDLAAGLERMAADSSAYYLLGYQPEKPPDGGWRDLQVKVARPGVRVRARRGYRALRPEDLQRRAQEEQPKATRAAKGAGGPGPRPGRRPLAPVLLAGRARAGVPLRMAAFVLDTNGLGSARVQVIVEIDNGRIQVDRKASPWKATLDLSILTAGLYHAPAVPVDERLELTLGPGEVGSGWWLVPREVWLPAGVFQVRALVRDVASGFAGLVTQRVEVPDVDHPYLSTPILADRTLPPLRPTDPPRLVPTASRRFRARGPLYCQYEVFGFGGQNLAGVPQLFGAYALEGPDGRVVSQQALAPIETDGQRAIRRLFFPEGSLAEGSYSLVVTVEDRLAGRTLATRAAFEVVSEAASP